MEWISVKDRLPDKKGIYLVVRRAEDGNRARTIGYWREEFKDLGINRIEEHFFTHWMPLPDLPEED